MTERTKKGFRFELESLPQSLRAQLKISKLAENTRLFLEAMENLDNQASIDEVVVELWKITKIIHKRGYVANKLWRMVKEGYLEPLPKIKGVYKVKK